MSKSFNYKQSTGDQLASVLGLLGVGSSDATMTSCLPLLLPHCGSQLAPETLR